VHTVGLERGGSLVMPHWRIQGKLPQRRVIVATVRTESGPSSRY